MTRQQRFELYFSPAAEQDFLEIGAYIARDSEEQARRFVDGLHRKCVEITDRPLIWPLVQHQNAAGMRRRLHAGYLIFYCVTKDEVEVVRIIHSARNYPALLFDD